MCGISRVLSCTILGCVELLKVAKCTTDFNPCNFLFSLPFWKEENTISVKTMQRW